MWGYCTGPFKVNAIIPIIFKKAPLLELKPSSFLMWTRHDTTQHEVVGCGGRILRHSFRHQPSCQHFKQNKKMCQTSWSLLEIFVGFTSMYDGLSSSVSSKKRRSKRHKEQSMCTYLPTYPPGWMVPNCIPDMHSFVLLLYLLVGYCWWDPYMFHHLIIPTIYPPAFSPWPS